MGSQFFWSIFTDGLTARLPEWPQSKIFIAGILCLSNISDTTTTTLTTATKTKTTANTPPCRHYPTEKSQTVEESRTVSFDKCCENKFSNAHKRKRYAVAIIGIAQDTYLEFFSPLW